MPNSHALQATSTWTQMNKKKNNNNKSLVKFFKILSEFYVCDDENKLNYELK